MTTSWYQFEDGLVQKALQSAKEGDGNTGDAAYWAHIVNKQKTLVIVPTDAYVVREAPVTATSETVAVTYYEMQTTAVSPNPTRVDVPAGLVDYPMQLVGKRWLVSSGGIIDGQG